MQKNLQNVNIMIVDDHPLIRRGLRNILESEKDFVVCSEASNASDAIRIINDSKPRIVIVDISLEGTTNGIELVKAIKERYPDTAMLVLSMHEESIYAERAIRAGAFGYVMKKEADDNIVNAIRTIIAGDLYLSNSLSKNIVQKLLHGINGDEREPENILTDRELEIFIMIGNGISTREISSRLNLSINTVETHRRHIRKKMQFDGLSELMKYAVRWVFVKNN